MSELKRTQLYDVHVAAGATMVDFGGWEMPIQYPSGIIAEHLYTRQVCSCHYPENYITLMEYYDPAEHGMEAYTRK